MLSSGVRLEIYPKFGFDGLAALLAWSSHSVVALDESTPINVEEGVGLVEIFARRFVEQLQPVLANGWIPTIAATELRARTFEAGSTVKRRTCASTAVRNSCSSRT